MRIHLNRRELAVLDAPQKGSGGFQSLMRDLSFRVYRSHFIDLTPSDLERIPRYAFDYGNGGWEDQLMSVFGRHLGYGLGRFQQLETAA